MDTPISLNSLTEPDFPITQEHASQLTPEVYAQIVGKSPQDARTWFQYLKDMEAYKTELQRCCAQLEEKLRDTTTNLSMLQVKTQTLDELLQRANERPATASTPRSMKLPDPDKFDGQRADLDRFLTQLRLKLQTNSDHFPTENARLGYAISRLDGVALKQVTPRLKEDKIEFDNLTDLFEFLQTAFGDPNRAATAKRELMALRQKNQDFSVFIAEFNRIAPDTGLDEASQKFALQQGLSSELQTLMIHHDEPASLKDYIKLLQHLDSRMRAASAQNLRRVPLSRAPSNSLTYSTLYAPASTHSHTSTAPATSPTTPSLIAPSDSISQYTPMDLSNARRGPVPSEEKERRRRLGLCGYCGKAGHNQFTCQLFRCYNCGEVGHGVQGCTKPKKQRLQELVVAKDSDEAGKGESLD